MNELKTSRKTYGKKKPFGSASPSVPSSGNKVMKLKTLKLKRDGNLNHRKFPFFNT